MRNGAQTIFYGCTEEISKELRRSEIGSHFLVEYPDLPTLREMYSHYTKSALYDGNEIVVVLPFYETVQSVRRIPGVRSVNCLGGGKHYGVHVADIG
jgi:hypothetical protein